MANALRVMIETGPKGKKTVALAPDWPGLARGAKTGEAAVERLLTYVPRYAPVAALAGLAAEYAPLAGATGAEVVGEYEGTGSTDFWGISFGFSAFDHQPMSPDDFERNLRLLQGAWTFFDGVRGRVSAEMRKGPRGGGRDRDRIVRHTVYAEFDMAWKVQVSVPDDWELTEASLQAYRDEYLAAIRSAYAEGRMNLGKSARKWPLRYLIRHTAFHTLDHAWEMEDKDLSGAGDPSG
jgi:hypothetical protein